MTATARPHVNSRERRARLAIRHRLLPDRRTDDVVAIADDLVALHSSDPTTVYLSALVRMQHPSIEAIDTALYEDRTLIRHHAMRRTIWVMSREVAVSAHASSTRKVAANERRKLLGWLAASPEVDDPERWIRAATAEVLDLVAGKGTVFTRDIGIQLPELTIQLLAAPGTQNATPIPAHTRIPLLGAMEGHLLRARPAGSWTSGQYSWAALDRWIEGYSLQKDTGPSVEEASADLVSRLLARFGPMTTTDLRWWTGWTKGQTTQALAVTRAVDVDLDGDGTGWVGADDPLLRNTTGSENDGPWVAVLPSLDPTTMGWKERGWYVGDDLVPRLFDRFGNAGPTIWADGRIVGGWAQRPTGDLAVDLCEPISSEHHDLLDTELDRLTPAIGDTRFSIRFPSPSHRDLLT